MPKIWGNTSQVYRSLLAALAPALCACSEASVERVAIVAHYVPACAPATDSGPQRIELVALGDFDRSNDSVSILESDAAREAVSLPQATRAVELTTLGGASYWGSGERGASGAVEVLLWPERAPCALLERSASRAADASRFALGAVAEPAELVVMGAPAGAGDAGCFAIDLGSGAIRPLALPEASVARRGATLSAWGGGLLWAGGSDEASDAPLQSALSYDPSAQGFTAGVVALRTARTRHAALGLATGASVLIGGEGSGGTPLASAEIVFADTRRKSSELPLLEHPRIAPGVALFPGERILVGGGYTRAGTARVPDPSVELVSLDLSAPPEAPLTLAPAALDRAFVSLGPGGALAVGGCQLAELPAECVACGDAGQGCVSRAVWWIDPSAGVHELAPLPRELMHERPLLVSAGAGAPWLIAGRVLGRFDPWQARFEVSDVAPGPAAAPLGALGIEPGLFVWLSEDANAFELRGLRHSQRAAFSQDVAPLLVGTAERLIPYLPPSGSGDSSATLLRYGVSSGLELRGAQAAVSVADTTYAELTLELTLAAGPPPLIRLEGQPGAESESEAFGTLDCPWPAFQAPESGVAGSEVRLLLERQSDRVRLRLAAAPEPGAATPECVQPLPERVSVRLTGTALGTTRLTRIELHRSVER